MYSLDVIHKLNRRGPVAMETETSRHCSINETPLGLILHSAKQRNTLCITDARERKKFSLAYWGTNSPAKRDQLVESYFS